MLDEADQMLERGFAESVEEILAASFSSSGKPGFGLYTLTFDTTLLLFHYLPITHSPTLSLSPSRSLLPLIMQQAAAAAVLGNGACVGAADGGSLHDARQGGGGPDWPADTAYSCHCGAQSHLLPLLRETLDNSGCGAGEGGREWLHFLAAWFFGENVA